MQPRYSFIAIFLIVILVVFVRLNNTNPGLLHTSPTAVTPSYVLDEQAENVKAQVETSAIISATSESAESQVTLSQDGLKLLQDHCAKCHVVQLLEQSKKPRADWEKALSRMETFGVRLTDTEKNALLDHLTAP